MKHLIRRRLLAQQLLIPLGIIRADSLDKDIRNDAGETASFTRALDFVISEAYRVEYPELKARQFIPIDTRVPAGAQSFTWRLWDWAGMAKIISDFSDDLPTVEIMAAEVAQLCKTIGIGYYYSLQDIRASALMGMSLDTEKSTAARRAHENQFDYLCAFGNADAGLPGFLNNSNVPVISAPTDLNGDWGNPATTPEEILSDLHAISASIYETTKGTASPDTMLLPPIRYKRIAVQRMSQYDSTTILQAFRTADPYIRNVDQWNYLDAADAASTGPRAVAYKRDPSVVAAVEPMPFTQQPPQVKNLGFSVPCESRIGGVSVKKPLNMVYADGI